MQNIDCMPEFGHVDQPVLAIGVNANLANSRPDRGHGFPVTRVKAVLYQFQFVRHLLADYLSELPHAAQTSPIHSTGLSPSLTRFSIQERIYSAQPEAPTSL